MNFKKLVRNVSRAFAPQTAGLSLLVSGKMNQDLKKEQERERAHLMGIAVEQQAAQDEEARRVEKEKELAGRKKKTFGLASLIGGDGSDTLG